MYTVEYIPVKSIYIYIDIYTVHDSNVFLPFRTSRKKKKKKLLSYS